AAPYSSNSFQVVSPTYWPPGSTIAVCVAFRTTGVAFSCVPPTPVTSGSLAGLLAALKTSEPSQVGCAAPSSPDDANNVQFCATIASNTWCSCAAMAGRTHCSASPKLCESTSPSLWSSAYLVAERMSASSSDFARTSTRFAPGATACDHWTSSEISADQPT